MKIGLKQDKLNWQPLPVLDALLGEVLKLKIHQPKPSKFRISSLPYCPIFNIYEDFHSNHEYNYSTSFYTGFGNAIHATFQEFLPHHPTLKIFGDWECGRCLKKAIKKFNNQAKKELSCKKGNCWVHVKYKEFELIWRNLSGHTDMLLYFKGKWYLLDFKSTSSALWRSPAATLKSREFPSKKYYEQIESYAALLFKLYKIKIDYYAIVYVGRDSLNYNKQPMLRSFSRRFNRKLYTRRMKRLRHFDRQYGLYRKFLAKPNKENRKKLVAARPCHNATDYANKMQPKFEFGPCPLWSGFQCRTDSGIDNFLKDVASIIKVEQNVSK